MEKHACVLCGRRFSSGRALGGHMRSHVISAKAQLLRNGSPSPSPSGYSSSFSVAAPPPSYGLRENPRKSFRVADPEFSSAAAAAVMDGYSSVVQDGESETESSMAPILLTRRQPTPEIVSSSVSDATTEEDVARCLMLLSRDIWTIPAVAEKDQEGGAEDSDEEDQISGRSRRRRQPAGRSRYQCGTCKKVFRSYQALGGHRAGHKKLKGCGTAVQIRIHDGSNAEPVHKCPVCFRVFGSGQALGGHKRSHLSAAAAAASLSVPPPPPSPFAANGSSIDLNLPAPMEEEIELSVVSYSGFASK